MEPSLPVIRPRRGRPPKFTAPSRPVTVTLPVHVIEALTALDMDLSRAIVRMTQPELERQPHPPAELASFGRRAVIVVNPSRTLEQRTGVVLVPMPDGRALISFEETTTPAGLELKIADALDDRDLPRADREVFEAIGDILKSARRSSDVVLLQRSIIVLEGRRKGPARSPVTSRNRKQGKGNP